MAIRPATYNFIASQGSTFNETMILRYSNLTPFDFDNVAMQVRETYSSQQAIVTATVDNGYITIDSSTGTINIEIPASVMENVVAKDYLYDVEVFSNLNTRVTRIVQGKFTVTPEVTRIV